MHIRPNPVYLDNNGNPAVLYEVYIGKVNTDPKTEGNKLVITDGIDGNNVSNPYPMNLNGYAQNANGERVDPYIVENEYSIEVRAIETGNLIYRSARIVGDAFGSSSGGGSSNVDAVINNFASALTTNMTDYDLVYIQSYSSAWEGTADGPSGDFYAYRTGGTGAAGTGNPGKFYDAAGNEFKPIVSQRLYAEMFGAVEGAGNDSYQAIQDMFTAGQDLGRPVYLDGKNYYINTQNNTAPNYSLIAFYALKIDNDLTVIGSNTTLHNTTVDSGQWMIFAEDVDKLKIEGLTLDGNATATGTGALYVAGCDSFEMRGAIINSDSLYLSASTNRMTNNARGDIQFSGMTNYAINGNSGGFKKALFDSIGLSSCAHGINVTNKDIDGHSIALTDPEFSCPSIIGDVTGDLFRCYLGKVNVGSVDVSCAKGINFDIETGNFTSFTCSSFRMDGAEAITVSSTTGIVESVQIDNFYGENMTNGFTIDSASQLIGELNIGYIDISGTGDAFTIGDNTQNGNIRLRGGIFTGFVTGFTINQTNGQNLYLDKIDMSGLTTRISDTTKSNIYSIGQDWRFEADISYTSFTGVSPPGWTIADAGSNIATVTHNLGHTDYAVSVTCLDDPLIGSIENKTANSFDVLCEGRATGNNIKNNFLCIVSTWFI